MAGILNTSHIDNSNQFDEIGDDVTFNRLDQHLNRYTVSNPHPAFGKDPNIKNELGHTEYPMWVTSKLTGGRVVVQDAEERAKHEAGEAISTKPTKKTEQLSQSQNSPWSNS